jgi:hypothetical protein
MLRFVAIAILPGEHIKMAAALLLLPLLAPDLDCLSKVLLKVFINYLLEIYQNLKDMK